jgi:cellulose synthase (UDP-forming)
MSTAALLLDAIWPGIMLAGAALLVLPCLRPEDVRARAAMVAVMLLLMWRYLLWRWLASLPPLGFTLEWLVGIIFITTETLMLLGTSVSLVFLARTSNRSPDADRNAAWLRALKPAPLVDVFICTYNEEEAILERTIIGALAMDYPRFRVWVLDDGRRAWLRRLCDRLGSNYLTRADNAHAKAGNINNGLKHVAQLAERPDFVGILDADFVPTPQFLSRSLGLFRDAKIGIVQTPQHFINPDPLQSNLATAQVWPDEQRFFFDVVMASKDAWGAAFCCGTSSVLRFEALEGIGGFPTESVTEDYLVTLKMKAVGYRTVYLNERLSLGLAPEGLKEYVTQRSRWALGFVQICRGKLGPLRWHNGLTLVDRICLIETFLYWFANYAFRLLGIIVPILYWLLNINSVQADVAHTLGYFLPHFVAQILIVGWMTQGRVMPVMSDVTQLLAASQILKAVVHGLLKPQGQKFHVTAKGGDRGKRFIQWPLLSPFVAYLVLTIAGVLWAFLVEDGTKLRDSSALCLFWSWYNIIVLAIACLVCVEQPRLRSAERLSAVGSGRVSIAGREVDFPVLDVSLTGARLAGGAPAASGALVSIAFDGVQLPAHIARCGKSDFAIRFADDAATRAKLVRLIYSGRYAAAVPTIAPKRVAAAVLERVMR